MNVLDLLSSLRKANIQITLVEDKLKIKAPPGALTPEIKAQLQAAKQDIIEFLQETTAHAEPVRTIEPVPRDQDLPLSYTQEALWTLEQMNPGTIAYNLPMAFRFYGKLDANLLQRAITTIIERHESLRTTVGEDDAGRPRAVIQPAAEFQLPRHQIHIDNEAHYQRDLKAAIDEYALRPFDLQQGPLYRFDLLDISGAVEPHRVLVICLHHMISDGLSQNLLVREIALLYAAGLQGAPSPLPPLPVQYPDFAAWQRQQLTGERLQQELDFWRRQLAGVPALLALPTDRPRPPIQTSRGARHHFELPANTAEQVLAFCRQQGYTTFMGLMAALQMVLSRHAGQTDFCLGMPTAGRHYQELEQLIGFFVNGVLVRAQLEGNPTWQQHLEQVKQRLLDVLSHQETPAQLIIEHLDVPRNPSYPPLAQVGFQLQNFSGSVQSGTEESAMLDAFAKQTNLRMEPVQLEEADSKFDMIVSLAQQDTQFRGYVEYNTDLFDVATIERLVTHFVRALDSMVRQPQQRINSVELDTEAELARALGVMEGERILRLTTTQMAFVQDIQLRPETRQYAVGFNYALYKPLQHDLLQRAVDHVLASHSILQARFVACDLPWADAAYQIIAADQSASIEIIDIGEPAHPDDFVARHFDQWCYRTHDVFNDTLIRFQLLESGNRCWLLLSCHHIILDGISGMAMLRKIIAGYEALLDQQPLSVFEDGFPEYVAQHHLEVDQPSAVAYWRQHCTSVEPLTFSYPTAWRAKTDYRILRHAIGDELWQQVQSYCRRQKTHPSILFRLVAAVLIRSYCRPEGDFVIWDIQSGRQPGQETEIGVFYQQVPYIIPLSLLQTGHTAADFFAQQRRYRRDIRAHTYLSLATLNQLFPAGSVSFQFNYFNFLEPVTMDGSASLPDTFSSHVDDTVQVFVKDYGASLDFELWFDGQVFAPLDFLPRMESITAQLVQEPERDLAQLMLDLPRERLQLQAWNQQPDHPANQQPEGEGGVSTLQQWLIQSLQQHAGETALVWGDQALSYSQLDTVTNQLANLLVQQGVQPGARVAVFLGRSQWPLIAIVACIKAGAAYVPIEASYPGERVAFILADSGATLLLTERCLRDKVPDCTQPVLTLDTLQDELATQAAQAPAAALNADHPLYVIYTSGSTGQPKGALVTHRGAVNLQQWYTGYCQLTQGDRTLIVSALGFDLTQKNLFAPLLTGAAVVIPQMQEFDAQQVADEVARHQITHLNCAPSALYALVENCDEERARQLQTLRWVFLGGEPIRLAALQPWLQFAPTRARLVNSYGPTECTDVVASYELQHIAGENQVIPIGRPIPNMQLWVLDDALNPVPPGLVGEICVAGPGVGPGYIGRDELTGAVFVDSELCPGKLYRTGDLGRFAPDGNLEYLGRKDFQIKLRGLRIELGEVESAIESLPGIDGAVVLVHGEQLVGYGLNPEGEIPSGWQGALRERLPEYMVPSHLLILRAWPLTPNGKIDRKALPLPEAGARGNQYVAPRNDTEAAVAAIWSQILQVEPVGVEDNFFDLGGHSLLANQIVSRLRKQFAVELPIRDLILHPTVAQLAGRITNAHKSQALGEIEPLDRNQRIPLSAQQQRLWLLDQIDPGNPAYHVPSVVTIKGDLDPTLLEQAFATVVNRHEGLRACFQEDENGPRQIFLEPKGWRLEQLDVSGDEPAQLRRKAGSLVLKPFRLDQGPLFRAALLSKGPREHILLVVLHHIVTDGWSNGLLVRELGEAYLQLVANGQVAMSPLPLQYADYAAWQADWLHRTLDEKLAFWHQALEQMPALELPLDHQRPRQQTFNGASVPLRLSAAAGAAMGDLANQYQATPFMILLAAYGALLQRYSGQERFAVGTPVAGRDRPELEPIVGFFVNTVAIPLIPQPEQSFARLLEQIKATALDCFEHQDVPFEQIVEQLNPQRDMSRSPIFQVMLAYQNLPQEEAHIGAADLGNIRLEPYELGIETAKFEQTLTLWPEQGGIAGSLNFNTDLFSEETAARFVAHFTRFCEHAFTRPDLPLYALEVLPPAEIQQQLVTWNQTGHPFDAHGRVEHRMLQTAASTPGAVAVVQGQQSLSYQELEAASRGVVWALQQQGVQPGASVGVVLDRHLHLMSALLGVLRAGAVYVPIDGAYPAERIRYICEQSAIECVITLAHLADNLPQSVQPLWLESVPQWTQAAARLQLPEQQNHGGDDWLYVIYTSGSTGRPKGTAAYHRSEINLLQWYTREFSMNANDRVLLLSAIGFDLTQKNLFAPLWCGARLVLPAFQEYDPGRLVDTIEQEEITWLNCAPSAFYPLVENPADWPRLGSLRYVFLGGEPINLERLAPWLEQTACRLINSYGPTECADIAAWHEVTLADRQAAAIPIGRPNDNVELYILGEHQELLPVGASGELYIGGAGVGPGYLNQPELTARVFLDNPHQPGQTIYRTGDRVRYRPDGAVIYLGRRDYQIKLRGYRVEAGEIQALINQHPQVIESLVDVVRNNSGVDQLVAWVATGNEEPVTVSLVEELKHLAVTRLPAFMVPDAWVTLAQFPLTANGKIDRHNLPAPQWQTRQTQLVAPRTETECLLAEIWAEVLQLDQVGTHDNFFELGGHSLLATQVAARLRSRTQKTLAIRDLMAEPTIAALAAKLDRGAGATEQTPLLRVDRQQQLPLSFAQQRLWLLDQIEGTLAYSVPSVLRVRGPLDESLLQQAVAAVCNRHEGLRTVFPMVDDTPCQQILPEQDWPLPLTDVRESADSDDLQALEAEARRLLAIDLLTPFDLATGPLFRCRLLRLGERDHIFLLNIHHIVTDGWSMNLLVRDLATAYLQLSLYGQVQWQPLPIQYVDFAVWQRQRLDPARRRELSAYWQQQLAAVEPLALPTDFPRPAIQTFAGASQRFTLSAATRAALQQHATAANTSLFAALMSGFFILLRQYSGQDDFCIGTPVAGRELTELEQVVGFFVNTLAVRQQFNPSQSFRDLLTRMNTTLLDGYAHQELPFEQIVEEVVPARDMSRPPLFQVMLVYQNLPLERENLAAAEQVGDIQLEPFTAGVESSKYELTMTLWDQDGGLGGSLQYNTDLFAASTVDRLLQHFCGLLDALAQTPDTPIATLQYLPPSEREQQLVEWNLTEVPYDRSRTLDQWLGQSLQQHQERIAVHCGEARLSFRELDQQSRGFASLLQQQGVSPGDRVALCVDRNLHLMTMILGIIRAGATYVPLDTGYPRQRIQYILEQAQAGLVVTQEHLREVLPESATTLVWEQVAQQVAEQADHWQPVSIDPEQLLYLIFTSGSTGNPKGTGAYHRSEVNLLNWYCRQFNLVATDRVLLLSAVGFDLTQKNLFAPLLAGATLVIPEFKEFDADRITTLIEQQQISWLNCAPSAFYPLQDEPCQWRQLDSLRLLFLGGEPINLPRLEPWLRHGRCQLINSYGPTECADIAAWYAVDLQRDLATATLPIGRPNDNVKLYVLGEQLELLPLGAVGELCIGGDGVGPGYLNNPEQTRDRFVANPHIPGETLYRTGDRVRYRADGNLEYLGRQDHQIKLRGYRVEAAEIQAVINQQPAVRESLVDVVSDSQGVSRLVAWVVTEAPEAPPESATVEACRQRLPGFMVPEQWVWLPRFPLTPNGKVDRKALPAPELLAGTDYVAPETEQERELASLWSQVLGVERIGRHDDFFSLGGQSLLATRLTSRLSRQLGRSVSVRALFENPTIAGFCQWLEHTQHQRQRPPLKRRPQPDQAPLSFGQQRLWFFEQMNPGTRANNMPVAVRIKGPLEPDILQRALQELCRRHEALRTCFSADDQGEPVQWIREQLRLEIPIVDLTGLSATELEQEMQRRMAANSQQPFMLEQAPLWRVSLLHTGANPPEWTVLLCMHHIISDGASQVILLRELMTLYLAYLGNQPSPLPELRYHYGDFAHWQRQWLDHQAMEQQLNYWQNQLRDAPPLLDLPLDKPRPDVQTTNGATLSRTLPAGISSRLQPFCEQQQVTPFMVTLLAWQLLLYRFSGQDDVVVGVPTLGRNDPELENVIGFFIQSLVLRSRFADNPRLPDALQQLRETVLAGFANGDVPVDKIVESLGVPRHPAYSPLVQVAFQLLDEAGFQVSELTRQATVGDMEVEVLGAETASAKFDLTLNLTLGAERLNATLEYNTDLFLPATAERLLDGFQRICEAIVQGDTTPVAQLPYLTESELMARLQLDPAHYESVQPLTRMQHDMFMDNLVNPRSLQSSHGWSIAIHRPLDPERWHQALRQVVIRQPMLRARFVAADEPGLDMGYLAIACKLEPHLEILDYSQRPLAATELEQLTRQLIYRPYAVQTDPLIRYYAIKLAVDHWVVVTAVHHALLDGAALHVLWQQLTKTYEALAAGRSPEVSTTPFVDYVRHDHQVMDTQEVLEFWRRRLAAVEPLDFTVPPPVPEPGHFVTRELILPADHWDSVKQFCRQQRVTPALYFKCLFGYLIQQYCRPDAAFSIQETMGGRIKGHQEAMGCFIQEIPFVFDQPVLAAEQRFVDVLEYARQYQKAIKDQRRISIGEQLALSPRGRIGFMYNYYQFLASTEFLGETFSPEGTPSDPAGNVQFVVTEVAGQLKWNLFYHGHLFTDLGMLARMQALSEQVLQQPEQPLSRLQLVADPGEQLLLLETWNDTRRDYDLSLCLHQRFELQAAATPEAPAIRDDQGCYSYRELNDRANRLAHYLLSRSVQPDDLVGLCAYRSREFLVGILGILKAGAAYVPMDPKYPDDRIEYMIADSRVSVLITEQELLPKSQAAGPGVQRLCLDRDWAEIAEQSAHNPNLPLGSRQRAYMIYTSGSTGLPKGAMVRHDGALNHIEAECEVLAFPGAFSFLQTAPSSSDISVWQFLGPVIRGGQVVVLDDVTHAAKLFQLVQQHNIEVVELVPVALQLLMEHVRQLPPAQRELPALRWMMATGEAVSVDLVNDWLALYPQIPVVNAYGPTEAADDVIQCAIHQPLPPTQKTVPIGRPLPNLQVYILDRQLRLLPPGVAGEICIGGVGVGEGYWQQPDKTTAAFVPDPFSDDPAARLYRTGDLGRWLADGSVEYLDRVDNQVKIRGFRIELGEVEAALSALPGVRENVVIVRDDLPGGRALAAYVVPLEHESQDQIALDPQAVRAALRESLPDFMVPAAITVLDALPLTPAGKVDRKALPRPVALQLGGVDYVAPRNETEQRLTEIWEALLPVERIGVTDNFFELGGHSLIAVRIVARINKAFATSLPVATLLTAQTIESLARRIGDTESGPAVVVPLQTSEQPALFMIHPVGGDVLCYNDLARAMAPYYSVYGIRSPALDDTAAGFETLEALAVSYADHIQQVAEGPFRLLGQSLGGILALAVARELEQRGQRVQAVVMLDSFSPAHLRERQSTGADLLGTALGVGLGAGNELTASPDLTALYNNARQTGVLPEEMEWPQFQRLYQVVQQNHQLATQFDGPLPAAETLHFTARDNSSGEQSGTSWQQLLPALKSEPMPGGHETMMQDKFATPLAERIHSLLSSLADPAQN
ncbi:MAG: amino acid adenylation domain-containing protein [Pseudomonadota bacterium]|nr:amino acid adenylation domain-containing protein [Pseudomonadota bacterium]